MSSQVRRGTVVSFSATDWTALVQLDGADGETVFPVGQWIPSTMLLANDNVAVLMFDPTNSDDGLVVGAYGAVGLYTSGTWTGAYAGTTIAGTFTYSTNTGKYIRMGGLCWVWNRITITAIGVAPTGNMRITGLPFTAATVNDPLTLGLVNNFNYAAASMELTLQTVLSTTQIALHEPQDNAADVPTPAANFTNAACDLIFSGWYQLA